jgi:hypothetical protein
MGDEDIEALVLPSEEEIKVYSSVHEIAGDLLKTGPRRESDEQRPGLEPKSAGPP